MKLFRFAGINVTVDPLLIAIFIPAVMLGMGKLLIVSLITVLYHEAAHAVAAKLLKMSVTEIELMPFGGVAKIDYAGAPYPLSEFIVALMGPASNFVAVGALYALAEAYPGLSTGLVIYIGTNLIIGLFNLLPAYPLDGGRMLGVVLARFMSPSRAASVSASIGMICGITLAAASLTMFLFGEKLNISFLTMGIFVALAAKREKEKNMFSMMKNSVSKRIRLKEHPLDGRTIAVHEDEKALSVMHRFRSGEYFFINVVGDDTRVMACLSEEEIIRGMERLGSGATVGELAAQRVA